MIQNRQRAVATALAVVVLLATAFGTAPVAADHENDANGVLSGLIEAEADDSGVVASAKRTLARISGSISGSVARLRDNSIDNTPAESAEDVRQVFNANDASILAYTNERTTASTSADVLELRFEQAGEESSTVYLIADVNGSDYENATMVTSTTRTADEACTLDQQAADNAADELETFIEDYVTEEKNASAGYEARLASQYAGEVSCSFMPGGDE